MGRAGGAGTLDSVRVCVCNAVRAAPFWQDEHTQRAAGRTKTVRQSVCVVCSLCFSTVCFAGTRLIRRLMSPASHGRCTASQLSVTHSCEAWGLPCDPVTTTRVRACTPLNMRVECTGLCANHRMQDWLLRFFQFAACYEAHLPSVTVRDENAGGTTCTKHVCSCRTAAQNKRCVAGVG
jgi:hypothetical protein